MVAANFAAKGIQQSHTTKQSIDFPHIFAFLNWHVVRKEPETENSENQNKKLKLRTNF